MTFLEFLAAAIIGVYAMVGGATFNAAITAPENTFRLLDEFVLKKFRTWGIAAPIALFLLAARPLLQGESISSITSDPLIWVAIAHLALLALLGLAYWAASVLRKN